MECGRIKASVVSVKESVLPLERKLDRGALMSEHWEKCRVLTLANFNQDKLTHFRNIELVNSQMIRWGRVI